MNITDILSKVDHTLLKTTATFDEIKKVCDDAIEYHTASVCIPPCFVKEANIYTKNKIKICTVIGFPNGYNTTKTKVFETQNSLENGADEIDMVINISALKDKNFKFIEDEIIYFNKICNKLLRYKNITVQKYKNYILDYVEGSNK